MCGFIVHYKLNNNFKLDQKNFIKASKEIQHRGPDDMHSFVYKNINMIFYRLSIIDQSKNGRQPMTSHSGRYVIAFNGEIYNAEDLKVKINNISKLKGSSDTEILINLYEIYGSNMLKFLKGMFSLVIFDKKKNSIFTARDRFGIKPLYYFKDENQILFSSEIKPIISYLKYYSFEKKTFANFFFKQELDSGTNTFFENIKNHEPAVYKTFQKKIVKSFKYWKIYDSKFDQNKKYKVEHLSTLINKSITQHLVSDVKLSLLLSGGLDSSVLCYLINKNYSDKIETFTYDFSDNQLGETRKAKSISKFLGFKNNNVLINPRYILNNFEKICLELESPFTSIRLFGLRKVYKTINLRGFKVALEGSGGDEILGGYHYNFLSYLLDAYCKNKKEIFHYLKKQNKEKILNYIITLSYQNGSTKDSTPFINSDYFNSDYMDYVLNENFFNNYKFESELNFLQKSQMIDIAYVNLPRSLKYMDRLAMNSSVENRVPLLDHELASYCFNLENDLKINNNQTRFIMKKIFKNYPIYKFFTKTKNIIVDPQRNWLGNQMFDYFYEEVNSLDVKNSIFFNQKKILEELTNLKKNKLNNSFQLFQILTTIIFMKAFKKKYN